MTLSQHVTLARTALTLLFRGFVTWPASAIGILCFAIGLTGGSPISDVVVGVYAWANTSVRSAPPGHVLRMECASPAADRPEGRGVECRSVVRSFQPVDEAIEESRRWLINAYFGLVMVSFGAMGLLRLAIRI